MYFLQSGGFLVKVFVVKSADKESGSGGGDGISRNQETPDKVSVCACVCEQEVLKRKCVVLVALNAVRLWPSISS